eukprot:scaffold4967_cov116-Isochrysis_galbana.AAC.5
MRLWGRIRRPKLLFRLTIGGRTIVLEDCQLGAGVKGAPENGAGIGACTPEPPGQKYNNTTVKGAQEGDANAHA